MNKTRLLEGRETEKKKKGRREFPGVSSSQPLLFHSISPYRAFSRENLLRSCHRSAARLCKQNVLTWAHIQYASRIQRSEELMWESGRLTVAYTNTGMLEQIVTK